MTKPIKKTIIEVKKDRGMFLPLSDQVPKELFMLGERPVLEILVEEAISVGTENVVFLMEGKDERFVNLFKDLAEKESYLKRRGNPRAKTLKLLKEKFENLKFSFANDFTEATRGAEDFAYISSEKLIHTKESPLEQLMSVFKTSERPVIGLKEADIGEVKTEKIARGLFKLKGFSEESSYSMAGRGIFTSESRKFFEEAETLREAIENMLDRGHTTYGTHIEGKTFTINSQANYIKANIYYSLKGEKQKELKEFINEEELL